MGDRQARSREHVTAHRPRRRTRLLLVAAAAVAAAVLHGGPVAGARDLAAAWKSAAGDVSAPLPVVTRLGTPGTSTPVTFLSEGGGQGQAPACGGPGQRACCFLEPFAPFPACGAGLGEANLGQFPTACNGFGAATCMPKALATACGGEGQRACCASDRAGASCDAGLVERGDDLAFDFFVPVTGDATCRGAVIASSGVARSQGTCIKQEPWTGPPATIDEPTTGWAATPEPRGVLRGYLDMHLHLFGHMAHGGKNLVGEPAPIDASGGFVLSGSHNVNTALSPATDLLVHKNPYHGLLNDTSGDGTGDGSRTEFGAPYFSGWPKWTSTTHQQTYYVWLERAWRGGLRTTTLFASHVEALCKTSLKATFVESWPICENSMLHIVNQLKEARNFERFVDSLSGGPGLGWFRIVTTPQQARDAVRAGKLAVVLGIEVDNLFNCSNFTSNPAAGQPGCPANFGLPLALTGLPAPTTLEQAVNVIYDMGVRQVFPIHNFDNGFGAAASWMDAIAVGHAASQVRWWETRDCGGTGPDAYGFWLDNVLYPLMSAIGFFTGVPPIPDYISGAGTSTYASCNQFGLTATGPTLLQALMNKGMLIDIDHMSANSLDDTIGVTAAGLDGNGVAYPLLASHVQAFDLHQREFEGNNGRHERMRTRRQLEAIRASGGMVATMLKDDVQDTGLKGKKFTTAYSPLWGSAITDNCRHSSKSWAQAFQYAVDVMGGPVAMGSDFNGAAGHLGPRFGSDACGGWGAQNGLERPQQIFENNRVQYPFSLPGFGNFDQQVTGFKAFDYNVDGLAHIGLLPDMVADLQHIGMDPHYVDSLFCSAEAYIRVWERAEALSQRRPAPDSNRPWLCNSTDATPPTSVVSLAPAASSSGWHRSDVTATITATDADSGVARIDYTVTMNGPVTPGGAAGATAVAAITGEGNASLSFFATDVAGNAETPGSADVRIDRTAPTIQAARAPAANSAGWTNGPVTVTFQCMDALSGVESCAAAQTLSGEGANQFASGDALDNAGNPARAGLSGINIDRTAPVVQVTGVANGGTYSLGSVPPAGCRTSDAPSGVAVSAVAATSGGSSNGVGTFTAACTGARDNAGNTGSATASYSVRYAFNGFFAPVNNLPVVNTVRAGQTVPVKFSLSGNFGLGVLQGGIATSVSIGCTSGVLDPVEVTVTNPGASQFTYDPVSDVYQFNWKTERAWAGSCRRLLVRLDDGTLQTADFRLQ